MRRDLILIASFVLVGVFGGATVLGDEIVSVVEKVPSFFVANDVKHPVPVSEQGDPGRNAFTFFRNSPFDSGEEANFVRFDVPEGKRLVIESVSLQATLPARQVLVLGSVQTRVNGQLQVFHLGPTFHGPLGNGNIYVVTQPLTLYADGGTEVALTGLRSDDTGGANFNASLAGHLIDCEIGVCE